jgi:menaquinone-dependent protoporphyrinogen oxidase
VHILVSAASRHGATAAIADTVAETLRRFGHRVDVRQPEWVGSITGYDAIVLGSAVYAGRWRAAARLMARRIQKEVAPDVPVWLFSSGPVGNAGEADGACTDAEVACKRIHARGHRVFPGVLWRSQLSMVERAVVSVARAEEGDHRDWPAIELWATDIANELAVRAAGGATPVAADG